MRRTFLGGAALIAVACAAPAAPPASTPAPPTAPSPTPHPPVSLELPTATLNANIAPLWVGVDQGVFRRHGFEVEVKGLSPAAATQALQGGSVPFAGTGGTTVTAFASGARELVYIAGLLNKALFQLVAQPDIERVEDLRGKSVASTTAGSSPSIVLGEVLRRYGLEPERDVTFVYLREQPGILTGLVSGQVPAGFLGSPFNKQAVNQGYRLLLDTADQNIELVGLNLTTTRGFLEREPEVARRFVMGYVESIALARREPDAAVDSILRGTRGDDRAAAEEAYALYSKAWDSWPSVRAVQLVLDNLDVPGARDVTAEQTIDDRILRELQASGWLARIWGAP